MAVLYTYEKDQDKYYVTNNEGTDITYVLSKKDDCVSYNQVSTGTITPAEKKEITLSTDGDYELVLTNSALETATINILHYLELELSMIEDIYSVLCECECGCSQCNDLETDRCEALSVTRTKIDAYKRLTNPLYVTYLDLIYLETNCLISLDVYCDINNESITGSSVYNDTLIKKLIALDYLAFYFWELDAVVDQDDIDFVKSKYMTSKILCCVSKLNIDITALKAKIDALP